MAEIAREQKRQEQKEKARQAEMKAYDVKRKKMAIEAHAEALRKQQWVHNLVTVKKQNFANLTISIRQSTESND